MLLTVMTSHVELEDGIRCRLEADFREYKSCKRWLVNTAFAIIDSFKVTLQRSKLLQSKHKAASN